MKIQTLPSYKSLNFGYCKFFSCKKSADFQNRSRSSEIREEGLANAEFEKFLFRKKTDAQNAHFKTFLTKKGKLTREEYRDIKHNYPYIISECYGMCENKGDLYPVSTPKNIANAARGLKKHYDKIYGEDGYKILSIGTSPSPITEAMKLWDDNLDIIFAPISSLESLSTKTKMSKQYRNIATLMKYCTSKGLADDEDKKIVVLDYVQSGRALMAMGRILSERGDIEPTRIRLHSIADDLKKCADDKDNHWVEYEDAIRIIGDMHESTIEKMSNVPHFFMDESLVSKSKSHTVYKGHKRDKDIFREFDNFSTPEARAWSLCIANEMLRHTTL